MQITILIVLVVLIGCKKNPCDDSDHRVFIEGRIAVNAYLFEGKKIEPNTTDYYTNVYPLKVSIDQSPDSNGNTSFTFEMHVQYNDEGEKMSYNTIQVGFTSAHIGQEFTDTELKDINCLIYLQEQKCAYYQYYMADKGNLSIEMDTTDNKMKIDFDITYFYHGNLDRPLRMYGSFKEWKWFL